MLRTCDRDGCENTFQERERGPASKRYCSGRCRITDYDDKHRTPFDPPTRQCLRCGKDFKPNPQSVSGRHKQVCCSRRCYQRWWYATHGRHVKDYRRRRREHNRIMKAAWVAANRLKVLELKRRWREANRDRCRKTQRECYARDRMASLANAARRIERMNMIATTKDLSTVDTEVLKAALIDALNAVADKCLEAARIIHTLEERGEDLSDVRRMLGWAFHVLRRVACGHVSPLAFRKFAGCKALLEAVSRLKPKDQERLARGEKVPLIRGAGPCLLVDVLELSSSEIKQVFSPDGLRSESEQAEWRKSRVIPPPTAKAPELKHKPYRANGYKGQHRVDDDDEDFDDRADAESGNLLRSMRRATPKDLAEMVAEMVTKHPDAKAVVRELLKNRSFWALLTSEKAAD